MTDLMITRAVMAHEQRELDQALLEMPAETKRVPFAVRMAAHKAADAAALRRQMIEQARARYAA